MANGSRLPFLNPQVDPPLKARSYGDAMSRTRILVLGLVGLLLPVALAVAAYAISSRVTPTAESPAVQQQSSQTNDESGGKDGQATPSPSESGSGKCSEPEHASDPECAASPTPMATPTPSHSSDDSNGSGSDNSGKGSDSSGKGSGGGGHGKDD
jgi:hypothetical protein